VIFIPDDPGSGDAMLAIEVFALSGSIVEVRFRDTPYWFDLNALAGDPRDPAEFSSATANAALSRGDGFVGWALLASQREVESRLAADVERLKRTPEFARFLDGAQKCFASSEAPACLEPFVQEPIRDLAHLYEHPDVAHDDLTAREFVEGLWRATGTEGRRLWSDLQQCFSAQGRYKIAHETFAQLDTTDGWTCSLELTERGWKLTDFFVGC
jgi:hypothetical protein